jgi:hypothetical protein
MGTNDRSIKLSESVKTHDECDPGCKRKLSFKIFRYTMVYNFAAHSMVFLHDWQIQTAKRTDIG